MKKIVAFILSLCIISICIPVATAANYNGFVYEVNSDNTITITGYNDFSADFVNIPSQIDGKAVVSIGQGAFQLKPSITGIKIADTVKSVGSMAFYNCKKLNSVTFGSETASIGSKAFNSCIALTSINLKNVQTVGEYAFYGCTALTQINGGSNLKVIGKNAFTGCTALDYLDFGDALLYIGNYAFSGCTQLINLYFPDTLGYIGNSTFKGCTALSDITFGTGELQIDAYAFENCTSLVAITLPDNIVSIGSLAFALRASDSTEFSHNVTITCNMQSAGARYAKYYNVPASFTDMGVTVSLFGDIDNSGKVDTTDALKALRIAAEQDAPLNDYQLFLNDLNANGTMDTGDSQLMLKKAAGVV